MAFYQQTRTAKAAAIGTIMPWTGGVSGIPKGWILCDGTPIPAVNYPLLARAIGDTYNNGPSSFAGSFPNYAGNIVLPNLINKTLIDIETSYFGSGGTGETQDLDPKAATAVTPLIGANTDNGVKTIYNDITTDVVFTLNDRSGYSGKASGNTIGGGEGISKTVYISPRKLGRDHIKAHNHPGRYETLSYGNPLRPGKGVIPYSTFSYDFQSYVDFDDGSIIVGPANDTEVGVTIFAPDGARDARDDDSGFGEGSPGRVVAGIHAENPSFNYTPFNVKLSPLQPLLTNPRVDAATPIPYGLQGNNINLPAGARNYYPDITNSITQANTFDTLITPAAYDFNQITQSPGTSDVIVPHVHDEFDVEFVRGTLRPNSTLTVAVEAPNANLSLDNDANQAALQINFNTSQPAVTCIYIIRAY
jgi:hypothetical protein